MKTKKLIQVKLEITDELYNILEAIEKICNIKLEINSALRKKNPRSYHYYGMAVDIKMIKGKKLRKLLQVLLQMKWTEMIIYPNHIHLAYDHKNPNIVKTLRTGTYA